MSWTTLQNQSHERGMQAPCWAGLCRPVFVCISDRQDSVVTPTSVALGQSSEAVFCSCVTCKYSLNCTRPDTAWSVRLCLVVT